METLKFEYLYYYSHKSGTSVPRHHHNFYELVYYFSGTGTTVCGDATLRLHEGNLVLYPPQVVHDEIHHSDCDLVCIGFSLDKNDKDCPDRGLYFDQDTTILHLTERIKSELQRRQVNYKLMVRNLVIEILVTLNRFSKKSDTDADPFNFVKQFIQENLSYDIDIRNLVDIAGYSYDHFRHLFKENTGMSPKQYILHKKIENAKRLLFSTNESVSDIASASGFSNLSQFSVLFKKHTGCSPQNYRKGARNVSESEE